jgi:hypothetical protein
MFGWLKKRRQRDAETDSPQLEELKSVYPTLNLAAGELLTYLGPAFTGTANGHIETDISAAASVAGTTVLRATVPTLDNYAVGEVLLADVHDGQRALLQFMMAVAPGMGLAADDGWNGSVPSKHDPILQVPEMVGKLQDPLERVASRLGVDRRFHGHVAALAAIKLVAAGHQTGLLDEQVGKALAAFHLVAGSKTVPPAPRLTRGRER